VRERLWLPLPHVFVHALNALHAVVAQWMGQAPSLQAMVTVRVGSQGAPPLAVSVVTVRTRVLSPVSHDLVHAV
jgi:hypothetical protein